MRAIYTFALRKGVLAGVLALLCALLALAMTAPGAAAYADDPPIEEASSAPAPETASDPFQDAVPVDRDDGVYQVDVELQGGSGKATVSSPAEMEVFDGRGVVTLVWSSPHYDYMLVNGKKYLPTNKEGNSTFVVPVLAYDEPFPVVGDTTAMGAPHEIEYTVTVAQETVRALDGSTVTSEQQETTQQQPVQAATTEQTAAPAGPGGMPWPWIVFIVCAVLSAVAVGVTIGILRGYRNR